jgi:hypothetical protein
MYSWPESRSDFNSAPRSAMLAIILAPARRRLEISPDAPNCKVIPANAQ